jgi:hypothetical protein
MAGLADCAALKIGGMRYYQMSDIVDFGEAIAAIDRCRITKNLPHCKGSKFFTLCLPNAYQLLRPSLVLVYHFLTSELPVPYQFFTISLPRGYQLLTISLPKLYQSGMEKVAKG